MTTCGEFTKFNNRNNKCKVDWPAVRSEKCREEDGVKWDLLSKRCRPKIPVSTACDSMMTFDATTNKCKINYDKIDLSSACDISTTRFDVASRTCVALDNSTAFDEGFQAGKDSVVINYDGDGVELFSKCKCFGWVDKTLASESDIMEHISLGDVGSAHGR